MSHILKIEPIHSAAESIDDQWGISLPGFAWTTSLEDLRQRKSVGVIFVSAAYQVAALKVIRVAVLDGPACIYSTTASDISKHKPVYLNYLTDVTPAEYEAAVIKASSMSSPIVDITREGLAGLRRSAELSAPQS